MELRKRIVYLWVSRGRFPRSVGLQREDSVNCWAPNGEFFAFVRLWKEYHILGTYEDVKGQILYICGAQEEDSAVVKVTCMKMRIQHV